MKIIMMILIFISILNSKDEITWNVNDFAPFMILDSSKNDGLCIKALDLAIKNLPEYKHRVEISSFENMFNKIKNKKLICSPCLLKTSQREKNMSFSNPYNVSLGIGLLVKKRSLYKLYNYLNEENKVSFSPLLLSNDFKIGISKLRSFGEDLDRILEKHKINKKRVYEREGNDLFEGLFKMLLANRDIDGTLIYYDELRLMLEKYKTKIGDELLFYEIEGINPTTFGRIACTNTQEGQKVINDINANIKTIITDTISYQKNSRNEDYVKKMTPHWDGLLND